MQYAKIYSRMETKKSTGEKFAASPLARAPFEKYNSSDFLDVNQLKTEWDLMSEALAREISTVKQSLHFHNPLAENSWNKVSLEVTHISDEEEHLNNLFQGEPLKGTFAAISIEFCLSTAAQLIILRSFQKLDALAQQNGFAKHFAEEKRMATFYFAGPSLVKIAGLSIEDIANNQDLIAPSSGYKFLVEAGLVKKNLTHDKVVDENKDLELSTVYPNTMKHNIQKAAGQILALAGGIATDVFSYAERVIAPKNNLQSEFIKTTKEVSLAFRHLQGRIRETILNPQDMDFNDLKTALEHYLQGGDERAKNLAIYMMGLNTEPNVSGMYRKVAELSAKNNNNALFYKLLANAIKEFTSETSSSLLILTEDDLPMFISTSEEQKAQAVPNVDDLKKINGLTFQKSSNKDYSIDPKLINWGNVIPPQDVKIIFSEGGPGKFKIVLHYENEMKEESNLSLSFNTKKQEFDWSFLEDPNDPKMQDAKNAFLLVTKSILLNILKQADTEYQEKHKPIITVKAIPSQSLPKRIGPETPREPKGKEPKTPRSKPSASTLDVLREISFSPPEEKIRGQIASPGNDAFEKMMEGISQNNQNNIKRAIDEFNQGGIFKILRNVRHYDDQGKDHRVFELKSGHFRVLVTEDNGNSYASPEQKIRTFTILKIQDRANIFKRIK